MQARLEYGYDGFGNRVQRVQRDGALAVVVESRYAVDGWDPSKPRSLGTEGFDTVLDMDASNNPVNRRGFGAGFDDPQAKLGVGGAVTWYGTDHLGSARQLFDNSATLTGTRDYSAFGVQSQTGVADRYAFTGRELDGTTGLERHGGREYLPGAGRWTSEDDLGVWSGDANLHRYVGNMPTAYVDPSGYQGTGTASMSLPAAPAGGEGEGPNGQKLPAAMDDWWFGGVLVDPEPEIAPPGDVGTMSMTLPPVPVMMPADGWPVRSKGSNSQQRPYVPYYMQPSPLGQFMQGLVDVFVEPIETFRDNPFAFGTIYQMYETIDDLSSGRPPGTVRKLEEIRDELERNPEKGSGQVAGIIIWGVLFRKAGPPGTRAVPKVNPVPKAGPKPPPQATIPKAAAPAKPLLPASPLVPKGMVPVKPSPPAPTSPPVAGLNPNSPNKVKPGGISGGTSSRSGSWKPGDDIYAPTSRGTPPSDRTVGRRFWRNQAENPSRSDYTPEDFERMRNGKPPRRYNPDKGDFESMERSHEPVPKRDGGKDMVPRWPQEHAQVDPLRKPGY